jgi:hypothetical protein
MARSGIMHVSRTCCCCQQNASEALLAAFGHKYLNLSSVLQLKKSQMRKQVLQHGTIAGPAGTSTIIAP